MTHCLNDLPWLKNSLVSVCLLAVTVVLIWPGATVLASSTDGVIDPTDKYAWSEDIGWITFGEPGGNVHLTDAAMTGSAWSANLGWIVLNPASAGVFNDGEGNLTGQAWGENTGWIDFAGVTVDSQGYFHGYANGTVTGQISFNCANSASCAASDFKVRTDWRPRSARPACNNALDDDGDGLLDYPADPGCSSIWDTDETDLVSGGLGGGGYWTGGDSPDPGEVAEGDTGTVVEEDGLHQSAEGNVEKCQMAFLDVDGHWAYRPIEQLYCLSIVSGRAPGLFVPDDGATRAEITKMALLMNGYQVDLTAESSFPDIDGGHWAYRYIATAERLGVVNGYGDGLFRPDNKVSRAELVKIFLLAAGKSLPENYSYSFVDVPEYAWYYPYVGMAFNLDLLSGYGDGTFRPDREVTRAEAAKIAVYMMAMP